MKAFIRLKYIGAIGALLFLSACSVPKIAKQQSIKLIPSKMAYQKDSFDSKTVKINLHSYFNDPILVELYQKMVQSNPDLKSMQQRVLIANSYLKQSKLAFLPSVDVKANASATKFGESTLDGVGYFESKQNPDLTPNQQLPNSPIPDMWIGAQVSWELDVWGRLHNKKKAAVQRYFATTEGSKLLHYKLFTDVASLYYELIALDRKLAIYEANSEVQKVAFELISAQRIAGKATELAVQQFGAQSQNLLAATERVKLDIYAVEMAISSLIGEYGTVVQRASNFIATPMDVLNTNFSLDSIIHNRPDVKEAYFELQASNADVLSARADFFPRIELGGFAAFNSFRGATLFNAGSFAWQLLGGLTAPIFKQGQIKQEYYRSNRQQEISFLNYQKSVIEAYNELSLLMIQVGKYKQILEIKTDEFTYLDRAVDVSNDLYLTGYANYWEIINAQKQKLQVELDMIDYQLDNSKSLILLFKSMGGEFSE